MKTAKFPQIVKRKIGALNLVDLRGDLVGPWAVRLQEEISLIVKSDLTNALILNLRPVETIDSLGVKAVVENLASRRRSGIIRGSDHVMKMIKLYSKQRKVSVISGEDELVRLFGEDMAKNAGVDFSEKRLFRRIKTALSLLFSCQDKIGNELQFRAIVTNLSEAGLFAEYIDLDDIPRSQSIINPYELSLLKLQIKMPDGALIEAEGKAVHVRSDGEQVGIGIEFYGITEEEKKRIKQLLSEFES